eukprot:12904889-Prorocentrum_lima.AAC.1
MTSSLVGSEMCIRDRVKKLTDAFNTPWKCTVAGIIPRDGITIEEEVPTLVFLGMVVEVMEEKLMMHQKPYLENTLKKR